MKKVKINGYLPLYLGILFFSFSVLLFELSLTRVFSILQWNYLAFMIISIAFLGYGASGTFLSVFSNILKKSNGKDLYKRLLLFSLLFSVSSLFSIYFISKIPFDLYRITMDIYQLLYLMVYYLAITIPFFFAGICISLTISTLPEKVNKIYFCDLSGAAIGCISFLILANYTSLSHLLIISPLFSFLASFLFSLKLENKKSIIYVYVVGIFLFIILFIGAENFYSFPINPYKSAFTLLRYPHSKIIERQENNISRLEIIKSDGVKYAPGLSLIFSGKIPEQLGLVTDGNGLSAISKLEGEIDFTGLKKIEFTDYVSSSLGFHLTGNTKKLEKMLIIGPGGGLDILGGLYNDKKEIWGIEMNPNVKKLLEGNLANYSGNIYGRKGINILSGEGRSILKSLDKKFDLIQISLIGSSNTASGGFHSISENYLYTVEGFIDFWQHLSNGGKLSITRWLKFPPREILRLCSIG